MGVNMFAVVVVITSVITTGIIVITERSTRRASSLSGTRGHDCQSAR